MFGGNPVSTSVSARIFSKVVASVLALLRGWAWNRTMGRNIFPPFWIFCCGDFFQPVPQVNRVHQHLGLTVPVVDDDRQLDHVLFFELHRVHIGDDVAALFGGGGQVQHKAGVEDWQASRCSRSDRA